MKRAALILLFAFSAGAQTLTDTINAVVARPDLQHALWAIDVEDDSGAVLFERNAHTLVMPASNRKVFAAASALNCFGPDHRYATELWIDGTNLVIRGTGDPSLGGRFAFDRDAVFKTFIDSLRARGIGSVNDIIADVSAFDRITIPGSWKFGNLGADYAAPVDALAYNENVFGLWIDSCTRPVVMTDPLFLNGDANVTCGADRIAVKVDEQNVVHVTGAMSKPFFDLPAIATPGLYAAQAFRDALRHAGIEVRGTVRLNTTPQPWKVQIATIESQPLWELLAITLKVSQNLYAEMLFKSTAGTYADATDLERDFLTHEVGVDGAEFRFVDGSGLSSDDLVTAAAIVRTFRWMNAPARDGLFWTILATPGEEGTLRRRLVPLASRLRGKTGTIAGVNALSGIIAGKNGGYRYFSVVVNHHIAQSATNAIDDIVTAIADF